MALIENVIKRVRAAGFPLWNGSNFLDKDNKVISVGSGTGSPADVGASINAAPDKATPIDADVLALTDSADGGLLKKFTLGTLKATIETFLLGKDYVRVTAGKDLVNGTNQIITQASIGIRDNFLVDTALSDPGSGLWKMNSAAPALNSTVVVMIDYLDRNGTDLSAFMGAWAAGGTLNIRSATSIDTSFAMIAITAVADQSPSTYFQITGTYLAGSTFVGGEACVIQYVPPTNVGATITGAASKVTPVDADKVAITDSAAGNILKYLTIGNLKSFINTYLLTLGYTRVDTSGNLIDGSNNIIDGVNPVYAISTQPVSGVTALPAANTVSDGVVVALHKDCLVGAGRNPGGILLKADVANNLWRPVCGRQLLFSKRFGTITTPTLTMNNTTQVTSSKFNTGVDPVIPGGLFYPGSTMIIEMLFRRNSTLAGLGTISLQCFLGTDATTQTNNSQVWTAAVTDADDRDIAPSPELTVNSNTSLTSTRNISRGEAGLATANIDLSTLINFAANMNVTWRVQTTLDANNTIDFIGYKIWMVD